MLVVVHPGLGGIDETGSPLAVESAAGPLFQVDDLRPGRVVSRSVRIANAGDGAGRFVLSASTRGGLPLRLTITDAEGRFLYRGALARLGETTLGVLAPGEAQTYRFSVSLAGAPASGALKPVVTATFHWTAASV